MSRKLDAVNEVLEGIGEQPVSSLDGGFITASMAATRIDRVSRAVQERGWHFNTEPGHRLSPDFEGFIQLPANTLRVDGVDLKRGDLTQRGLKLYNLKDHTFKFTGNTSVVVDIVVLLDFDELPEAARRFITARSKRMFQDGLMGSPELHQAQTPDEIEAMQDLKQMDSEVGDYNIFDNYDLADWISRELR